MDYANTKSIIGALTPPSLPAAVASVADVIKAAPTLPLGRAPGTGPLRDSRALRATGTASLAIDHMPGKTAGVGTISPLSAVAKVGATAAALGELGVVGALAAVAKAYTKTTFDPQAIGASLGKLADNLQQVTSQVQALPGVGDALMGLGGLGAIVSGVNGLREGITAAKNAQDTPEKIQASLGAAAGAAKIVGGLAMALAPLCPPLGAVGAAITAASTAMGVGRFALENKAPLAKALGAVQTRIAAMVPPEMQRALDSATKIISNNSSAMVATTG